MMRRAQTCLSLVLFLTLLLTSGLQAQQPAGPGLVESNSSPNPSPRTFSFSGTAPGQPDGALSVTFALYSDQQGSAPLWTETQVVQITSEKYSTVLGTSSPTGLPSDIFAADQAHWLGVQLNGRETRYLLVSVPYAMKAVEAERLGGLLPSQYVTTQQLQSILQNSAGQTGGAAPTPNSTGGVQNQAAASGSTPLPATDFLDNNTSEVLLVTQQGAGYAIHAITSGQNEAIFAQNDSIGGTGLRALATYPSGQSIGIMGEVASPDGIAGLFNNRAAGKILSLRSNGAEVAWFDSFGLTVTGQITGNGSGLTNIPPSAVGATSFNNPNSVVARDYQGSFAATNIFASGSFTGNGAGLFNIPMSAIGATSFNNPNTVVARDYQGSFAATNIFASGSFTGNGAGLFNIPMTAIGATSFNNPNTVVARDSQGSFAATNIFASGNFTGNGSGLFNVPMTAIGATPFNNPDTVVARDSFGGFAATNIFASGSFTGNGSGLFNVPMSAIGATSFNNPNTVVARDGGGGFAATSITAGTINASTGSGTAIHGDSSGVGVEASSYSGVALSASATANDSTGTALLLSHASLGKLISGGVGTGGSLASESFSVDASGNITFTGSLIAPYETTGTWFANSLVKLTSNPGTFGAGTVTMTSPGDTSGAIGVITGVPAGSSKIQVAQGGEAYCIFDNSATAGHYVGISRTAAGQCTDVGAAFPVNGQQVIGRVLSSSGPFSTRVLLFGAEQHAGANGTLTSINTGAGLTGGPITSSGTISIANNGVTNTMLQNSTITVADGPGIGGGGVVPLGGTVTISNLGALSFNGRVGNIVPALGDYSFSQIFGTASESQLPASVVLNSQSNTFNGNQSINGTLTVTGAVPADNFSSFSALLSVNDTSQQAGSHPAFFAGSSNNQAAFFFSGAPTILSVGSFTHNVLGVTNNGMDVFGAVTATSFAGDGSGLTNVTAAKLGTLAPADVATVTALSAETTARQSADTTLQNNINSEASTRQSADSTLQANINNESTARASGDAALQAGINAETSARQSDVSNLQTSINNVSAADAKLAASNAFTAGTQDFSGAGATLPVRAVSSANTPASCVASKELLIKTDAPAGQQLFICNATANGWTLVGDGISSGGVTTFNGRSGSVTPGTGDYSFAQISGSLAASQLPALTGDVTSAAGSAATTLSPSGVTAGTYTKLTVDAKGRATAGAQASFADLSGSASAAQLPATVVYSGQSNTFTGNQTVNGTVTATSFSGSGAALTGVNAASLNGLGSGNFAQLAAANSFTAKQTLAAASASAASLNVPAGAAPSAPASGDLWNTGAVLQYRDNAATTRSLVSTTQSGGLQLLKLTASITPASVGIQACAEQSFTVSGISTGDVLLSVLQPSNASPGTNIAIGGFRVSAANTVAVQFCNVSRSNSTPTAGVYTFALMR